jgi:hypothetical protein
MVEPLRLRPAGNEEPEARLQVKGAVPPLAVSVALYDTPTVPAASVAELVMTRGAGLIVMLSCLLTLWGVGVPESVAVTVKVVVPDDEGVPDMVEPLKLSPAGNEEPEARLQVKGAVPPLAVSVALYDTPTVPAASVAELVMTRGAGLIVMLSCLLTFWGVGVPESVAVTVKVVVPDDEGVPEKAPEVANDSPLGKLPGGTVQVTGVVPPEDCRVAL